MTQKVICILCRTPLRDNEAMYFSPIYEDTGPAGVLHRYCWLQTNEIIKNEGTSVIAQLDLK